MIKFRKDLYISKSITNVKKAKWKIITGRGQFNLFLIVYNHDSNRLEYFHNSMLKQRILHKMDWDVVGLSKYESECIEIIANLLDESYKSTGKYDIGAYIN